MKRTSLGIIGVSALLIAAPLGAATAADMATKAPPPAAAPASPAGSCVSLWDFVTTACPLTWYGITVYGTIDVGGGWQSHGTPFSRTSAPGQDYLVQKASNRALWGIAPNGLSQSNIGVKGNEPIGAGWSFVFDLEAGFDPYSLQLANGPGSVAQNVDVPLTSQNAHRRFKPGGPVLQFGGLPGRQFADLRHADGFPAKRADFGRRACLRSDGRFIRILADRLAGDDLRRRRYRRLQIQHGGEISRQRRHVPGGGACGSSAATARTTARTAPTRGNSAPTFTMWLTARSRSTPFTATSETRCQPR